MTLVVYKNQLKDHCIEAASTIHAECVQILTTKNDYHEITTLSGCGAALVDLLARQANITQNLYLESTNNEKKPASPQKYELALKRLEDIASIAYSKFYAYIFKDLPVCWRQLYTDARILKFCLLFLRSPYIAQNESETRGPFDKTLVVEPGNDHLDQLVKTLDLALILAGGAGEKRGRAWIDEALRLLHLIWLEERDSQQHIHGDAGLSDGNRPAKRSKITESSSSGSLNMNSALIIGPSFSTDEPFTPPVTCPVKRIEALSIEEFQAYMDQPSDPSLGPEPLVLRNAIADWPALSTRPWNRPSYLLSQTFDGRRLVPVEIGRSYVDEGWGQRLITFGEFLREYIDSDTRSGTLPPPDSHNSNDVPNETRHKPKTTAYLAQHPLFTQLPALRTDILIPDYCYTAPPPAPPPNSHLNQPELDSPLLNAWFGPAGTISPLHNDPYHNILAQVVGRKYVRLYAPREASRLAARGKEDGVDMANTSRLDVGVLEGWDRPPVPGFDTIGEEEENEEDRHDVEAFRSVPFVDCILEPGDVLYIPIGWWHYVRGLSVSFSVSFWWN